MTPRDQLNTLNNDKASDANNATALAAAQKAKDSSAAAVATDTTAFIATIQSLGGRLVDTLATPVVEYTTDGTVVTVTQVSTLDTTLPDPSPAPTPTPANPPAPAPAGN